ncbi:histidinol dehydrogenase [Myceligenerans pegani]|uniref:Histidinol dehydrogenase n=1 Tax=Myceligenerans pegani TaxID=2776917 RepID=A0ABR9MYJ9_9MICO|nr:histidinol dehydrogenase [Myceligenerans sp. TRM 65318]MBE1876470.1 histidinol dehydrogenase [Myceligenerans sp. TRM 65318]MBE3018741.1 histidinol dehydrogenase [Myceligenerans sp. TRM 65318]
MIQRIDLTGRDLTAPVARRDLLATLPRAEMRVDDAARAVEPLLHQVRDGGAGALRDIAERFDGVRPEHLRVPPEALANALDTLAPDIRAGLTEAIRRVREVHAAQVPAERVTEPAPGAVVRQRYVPVRRVGLYVPGGLAVYPSSVVMNVVAAQTAGVPGIALASPPQKDHGGLPHPTILAACALLGVDEVYAVGGAQAVAMFAYGAAGTAPQDGETLCEPVDVVTGPGNVYVAAAKRLVRGLVGIDAEAGPTEIAVLADRTADATHVALDLVSQAEHDPMAASILVTDSPELADAVTERLADLAAATKHSLRVAKALDGPQSAIVLVDDIEAGLAVVDAYGAEHLEIQAAGAAALADRVHNAGAIFVGPWSPVSLGDYLAGSNHVLPTGGTARFASALGVHSFLKPVQVIEYTRDALEQVAGHISALANDEDLPAHGEAVRGRFAHGGSEV